MFNQVQIQGLLLNLIIYTFMLFPIICISFKKCIYNKNTFLFSIIAATIIEILLSMFVYIFSDKIFSIFTDKIGVINYAVYASKILFISSSLYSLKVLLPSFLFQKNAKKTVILVLSKITAHIFLIFICYILFNTKGILYSFPICDFVFYITYTKVFLNIFRQNI